MKNEIVPFEAKDGKVSLPVQLNEETVWLTRMQMAELFEKDRTVILRHIQNAIEEGEIDPKVSCAKFAQVTPHGAIPGKTRTQIVDLYNLDVIISVGYRVHSQRGVEFRRRPSAARSDGIRSALSFRATASSARTAVSPATAAGWETRRRCWRTRADGRNLVLISAVWLQDKVV